MNALAAPIAEPVVITAYEALKNNIAIAVQDAPAKVFNYRDAKDNKLCRSYLFGLRGLRGQIEGARKAAKAAALDYGRRVDSLAKEMEIQVDALIKPHDAEISRIDAEEKARIAKHTESINRLVLAQSFYAGKTSDHVREALEKAKAFDLNGLEEFKTQGEAEKVKMVAALEVELATAIGREAEAAELARLRAEKVARDEADRIARVQAEAVEAERARAKAADAKRIADEQAATVRAENEAKAAKEKAAAAAKAKIDAARLAEEKAKRHASEAKEREAKLKAELIAANERERARLDLEAANRAACEKAEKENRSAVTATVRADLFAFIDNDEVLDAVVSALVNGQIRHLRMDWEIA